MTFSLPVLALFTSALFAFFLAIFILTRLRTHDSIALGMMAVLMVFWSVGDGIEVGAIRLADKVLGTDIATVGYVFVPYFWFLFTVEFSRKADQRRTLIPYWLGLLPLVSLIALWFGKTIPLGLYNPRLETWGDLSLVVYAYGYWWFWGHTLLSYLFIVAGIAMLLYHLGRKPALQRAQIVALLVAAFLPTVGNLFNLVFGLIVDPTAFTFTLAIGVIFFAVFRHRLVNISPVARDLVVDGLRDGLVVVDLQYRIVDVNAAASRMIGLSAQQIVGKPLAEALKPWQPLLEHFKGSAEVNSVVEIGAGQAARQVGVRSSILYDKLKRPVGRIISFLEMDPYLHRSQAAFQISESIVQAPVDTQSVSPASSTTSPVLHLLNTFFSPEDIQVTSIFHSSPRWAQTIERVFTLIVRVLAVLGSFAFLVALSSYPSSEISFLLALCILVSTSWFLGVARKVAYGVRISIFFIAVYALTLTELVNYGYSPEGFALSLVLVALSTLLTGLRGARISFAVVMLTLVSVGVPIGAGWFQPLLIPPELALPNSLFTFAQSIALFAILAGGLAIAVYSLLDSLETAHEEETQTQNLLQQERDLLEQRVLDRTRDLAHARDQALEASQFKSSLLSRVSHDLRSPLTGVLGYAEMLSDGVFGELTAKQRDMIGKVISSANFLKTMINDLLDQAQLEARAVKIHLEPFEPAHLLESVNGNLSVLAAQKGLSLVSELDPALPTRLIGDELRLQQVLLNLVGNAIKFTDAGEVKISLAMASETHWKLCVADTGVGIPSEAQELIFESFRQVDNAVTRKSRGTGLGLSITKQLVELMGGEILLESEVGRGSTFTVVWALATQHNEIRLADYQERDLHELQTLSKA